MEIYKKNIKEALRTVGLTKQPDWVQRNADLKSRRDPDNIEVNSIFEVENINKIFANNVKIALPGIFGNPNNGIVLETIKRSPRELDVYQDSGAFIIKLIEKGGNFYVELDHTTQKYEKHYSVSTGKSKVKPSQNISSVSENFFTEMILEAYKKIEKIVDRVYEGFSSFDPDDKDYTFKTLGHKGDCSEENTFIGDDIRFVQISDLGECSKELYEKLKNHLGKIGRVVSRDSNDPDQYVIRFNDGFTFWFFLEEFDMVDNETLKAM